MNLPNCQQLEQAVEGGPNDLRKLDLTVQEVYSYCNRDDACPDVMENQGSVHDMLHIHIDDGCCVSRVKSGEPQRQQGTVAGINQLAAQFERQLVARVSKPGVEHGRERVQQSKSSHQGIANLDALINMAVTLDKVQHALEQHGLGERCGQCYQAWDDGNQKLVGHGLE